MTQTQRVRASVEYFSIDCGSIPARVHGSRFCGENGIDEYEFVVRPAEYASIEVQLDWINKAYNVALAELGIAESSAFFRRFFCSDLSNQFDALQNCDCSRRSSTCAISMVRQPPVPPVKVAMFAYHVVSDAPMAKEILDDEAVGLRRGELVHVLSTGLTSVGSTSYEQTLGIFQRYDACLKISGMTLRDNVVRTWFYVQNVDMNYDGLVRGRREFFASRGLTHDTHYIASTGIEGAHQVVSARVSMDAYAISGLRGEQVEYLSALDHLSPTDIYGVTFERGTSIAYRDRKHVFISGTASIDSNGRIVHPGNVARQLDRTLENIEALLTNAGAKLSDMCSFIVYVRDPSDHELVWSRMRALFPDAPVEVVVAPVCRPGWLVEIEGKAIISGWNPDLPEY